MNFIRKWKFIYLILACFIFISINSCGRTHEETHSPRRDWFDRDYGRSGEIFDDIPDGELDDIPDDEEGIEGYYDKKGKGGKFWRSMGYWWGCWWKCPEKLRPNK